MISLAQLADLARRFEADLSVPVAPLRVGDRHIDVDTTPVIMGCVNLSPDSTYRESVATSTESAVRKGRILAAQGADIVDVGAESSNPRTRQVSVAEQVAALVPVVKGLASEGVAVSVETYEPAVAQSCLDAGALLVNYSGGPASDGEMFPVLADHGATVVLCHVEGTNSRDVRAKGIDQDPVPRMLDYFEKRVDHARSAGVDRIVVDPGIGFSHDKHISADTRVHYQGRALLNTFRLRRMGLPICHSLPHAFSLFEDEFRTAEGFFTVLAHLGGTGVYRTHEVPRTRAVLAALRALGTQSFAPGT
ncbi:dihydropteroate synthase [Streptomyces sp. Ag109_O5-10]|uniref:dihydropteroate synthase n=1 Tax=Streptomyces sp. Ag109_O5-10 TaxID=1855349 RepID=UPI0008977A58|nr:dihydropteroate synthase [Streptomyces sp. Ag109_O5-10]SEE54225.1 dihydropteroate synthase [Streptomyces sp. Ag109_O5-10]